MTGQRFFGSNKNGNEFDELIKYPILTQDADDTLSPGDGRIGSGENARIVSNAIRDILGWQPRRSDPRGFVAALKGAFTFETVEGYTTWKWRQRAFNIDAGMGEITGAQATIYQQAQVVWREIEPLLEGLVPLIPDSDAEDVYASREIIRSTLIGVVNEFGEVGGPRVDKVDLYFLTLLGDISTEKRYIAPGSEGGELGRLRDRLGFKFDNVNTIEEERNLTNYLSIANYVSLLLLSWLQFRPIFTGESQVVFLGTHLVLLSQALEVVASSVEQLRGALRSVFLSDADQQAILLFEETESGEEIATITLAGLLDWIEQAVTLEWPHLIREAGKDGVEAILPPLSKLGNLVGELIELDDTGPNNIPDGFFSPRVEAALSDLKDHLDTAYSLADDINPDWGKKSTGRSATPAANRSATRAAASAEHDVAVEVTVSVPDDTPKNQSVFLQGDFSHLPGGFLAWDPNGIKMTRIGDTHQWRCELPGRTRAHIQYRYILRPSLWVETDAKGKYVSLRSVEIRDKGDNKMAIHETVAGWKKPQA